MNRLTAEIERLYLPPDRTALDLISPQAQVRALVIELGQAAGWNATAALWQGVQDELGLPAPAIAVSGRDGYQLWFSLQQAVSIELAHRFLELLRQRFLAPVAPGQIRLLPTVDSSGMGAASHAKLVPAHLEETDRWSAFVAPDLAALFADEPWLDLPPGSEAQADLLARLESTAPEAFQQALARLQPAGASGDQSQAMPQQQFTAVTRTEAGPGWTDPRQFLLAVMNDPQVEMRLRIEAARALLPAFQDGLSPGAADA
ncbi:MAG: hypothetical protein RLZZ555_2220 [Pseudomonadota bacterium]|jgi:hypothetical protein